MDNINSTLWSMCGATANSTLTTSDFNNDDNFTNYTASCANITATNVTGENSAVRAFQNPFAMPWWQQFLWSSVYGVMVVVATGGNIIVIWIVMAHKRMRTITNFFLVNVSVADAMLSTLNTIFCFAYMLTGHWPFGDAYCKLTAFVSIVTVAASVFTMMAISVDRYMAIMSPLRPRMSKATTVKVVVFIWICSTALAIPNLFYWITATITYSNGTQRTACFPYWPDGIHSSSQLELIYNFILTGTTYFLPLSAMTVAYCRVGRELWGSQSIGECTAKQIDSVRSKRRVVKMMMVVVIIFAVCWLPYHIYFLLVPYHQEVLRYKYMPHVYLSIYWLAMSNSMYNPFIYCWMNARFRKGFKRVFQWCPLVMCSENRDHEHHENAIARNSCSHSPEMMSRLDRDGTVRMPLHTLTDTVNEDHSSTESGAPFKSLSTESMLKRFHRKKPCHV